MQVVVWVIVAAEVRVERRTMRFVEVRIMMCVCAIKRANFW